LSRRAERTSRTSVKHAGARSIAPRSHANESFRANRCGDPFGQWFSARRAHSVSRCWFVVALWLRSDPDEASSTSQTPTSAQEQSAAPGSTPSRLATRAATTQHRRQHHGTS
jgi:hypothetical protein